MQHVLAEQWNDLPPALQAHYQSTNNADIGVLDIEYPRFMQLYLNFLKLLGALVNQRGTNLATSVEKWMEDGKQQWRRSITLSDGKNLYFNSHWEAAGDSEIIEYVNPFIGLRMTVSVIDKQLHYHGKHYIVNLGKLLLPIPEWLILGHTSIVESAINDKEFEMDFRLTHPLFGQLFRYSGRFTTIPRSLSKN